MSPNLLLILAVMGVGILHTLVPDHWAPIALLSRQQGWSRQQTIRTAAGAGLGHTVSTLLLAVVVWTAGLVVVQRFGHTVTILSSGALVAFGLWMFVAALRDARASTAEHGHAHFGHAHRHRHASGTTHLHWHEHHAHDAHVVEGNLARKEPETLPIHEHEHQRTSARTALLLIVGSSPMVEGIPAFFAAAKYGTTQLAVMAVVFAISTIATYVALVLFSTIGLERISLGPVERYGEAISGAFIALIGAAFYFVG